MGKIGLHKNAKSSERDKEHNCENQIADPGLEVLHTLERQTPPISLFLILSALIAALFAFIRKLTRLAQPIALFGQLKPTQCALANLAFVLRPTMITDFSRLEHFAALNHALIKAAQ
jgi:hypothetical protein